MSSKHPSIDKIASAYFRSLNQPFKAITAIKFCDNVIDTNDCLRLVMAGVKRATATSVWEFELFDELMPQIGDLYIVTDWDGIGYCVIQTTKITRLRFSQITEKHAYLEGEGDKSLSYWQRVHREYYQRQFEGSQFSFDENMEIIFEEFEVVYK